MNVQFTLYPGLIFETVKNETHISAHVQRASDKNASELAFHTEAGDESYHERKLQRAMFASIDKIKAEIIGFLDTAGTSANIETTVTLPTASNPDGSIVWKMFVSDRYNSAYLTPLADLASKYIEDNMLVLWWTAINPNTAKVYAEHTELDRQAIIKCFIKNAPTASSKGYGDVTGGIVEPSDDEGE